MDDGCRPAPTRRWIHPSRCVGGRLWNDRPSILGGDRLGRVAVVPMSKASRPNASVRTAPNGRNAGLTALPEPGCPPFLPVPSRRTLGRRGATPISATKARPLRWCVSPNPSIAGRGDHLTASWRGCWSGVRRTPKEAPRTPYPITGTQSPKSLAAPSAGLVPVSIASPWCAPPCNDQFRLLKADPRSILA